MVHTSKSLILPCWSGCTVVSIAVEVLICAWCWSLIGPLPWSPVSVVPSLTIAIAWSHNNSILHIIVPLWWRGCRARRLEVVALNLPLWSLKSLTCSLHSQLPTLLTWVEIRSLRGRTNMEPCVASLRSSALHFSFAFHDSCSVFQD
jgi:hypothetical protein